MTVDYNSCFLFPLPNARDGPRTSHILGKSSTTFSVLGLSFTKLHLGHHKVSGLTVRLFAQSEGKKKTSTRASKTKNGTISKELRVWATFPTPIGSKDKSLLLIELRKCRVTSLPCWGEDPITTVQTLLTAYKKTVTHAKHKSTWLQCVFRGETDRKKVIHWLINSLHSILLKCIILTS